MAAAAEEDRTTAGRGFNFTNAELPQTLPPSGTCGTRDVYKTVILTIYKTLTIIGWGDVDGDFEGRFISSKFCTLTNAQMRDRIRICHPFMADARATPLWLYKLLKLVETPPRMTRTQLGDIAEDLTDQDINDLLKIMYHQPTDNDGNPSLLMEYLQRWVADAIDGLIYIHNKARTGYEYNKLYDQYEIEVKELNMKVNFMLLSLSDRNTVYAYAQQTGRTLQAMKDTCEAYVKIDEEDRIKKVYFALHEFREVDTFDFLQQRTQYTGNRLWFYHITLQNPEGFKARSVEAIQTKASELDPLVTKIHGFQPSQKDIALEQAMHVKRTVLKLIEDITTFLDNVESRSINEAKSLLSSLKIKMEKCDSLYFDGVPYTEASVGADPGTLKAYHRELDNYIQEEERELKKREYRDMLEAEEILKTSPSIQLPPLNNITDWLNFKAALDRIMPYHNSDIVKCTLVKKALRDKADISRCRNMTYDGIMSYLTTRYHDSSLIPRLVDRLLEMQQAKDNQISYENLTEFLSIWSQLELHNGTDRIDSYAREKLVFILLPKYLQFDFLKEQIMQEKAWKNQESANIEVDDNASTTFSLAKGEEYEDKRRAHFVDQMKVYSEIIRRIVMTNTVTSKKEKNQRRNICSVNNTSPHDKSCPACGSSECGGDGNPVESLADCDDFRAMPVKERYELICNLSFCKKCLSNKADAHVNGNCKLQHRRCSTCQSSHHELIHLPYKPTTGTHKWKKENESSNRETVTEDYSVPSSQVSSEAETDASEEEDVN